MNGLRSIALLLVLCCPSGCFLAPAISSVRDAGITTGDRQRLLAKEVKEFSEALYWGDSNVAVGYVLPDFQPEFRAQMRESKKGERIVESRIENVIYADGAYQADVDVTVRYFKVPFYVVTERLERQAWEFTMSSGWKIKDRVVVDAPKG